MVYWESQKASSEMCLPFNFSNVDLGVGGTETHRHQNGASLLQTLVWPGSDLDMFSIIIRGSIEDEDIQISSDIYETFQSNISSVLDGEQATNK